MKANKFVFLYIFTFFLVLLGRCSGNTQHDKTKKTASRMRARRRETDVTRIIRRKIYLSHFIKRAMLFSTDDATLKLPPIVFTVVHGTWAKGSPEFTKEHDPTYKNIKEFSYKLSAKYKHPVLLLSFGWSGDDNEGRRRGAGAALAGILNVFSESSDAFMIAGIGHSHGGNVFHYASHYVKRPIDLLINFGTPTRGIGGVTSEEAYYRPDKIKKEINIYSTSDPIQLAGSVVQETLYASLTSSGDARRQPYQSGKRIVNVHIKHNAIPPGHVTIKDIVVGLYELIEHIATYYKVHNDLVADVLLKKNRKIITVAINDFLTTRDLVERTDIDLSNQETVNQITSEVEHNREQERQYYRLYPGYGDIRSKGSMFRRMAQTIGDAMRLIRIGIQEFMQSFKKKATKQLPFRKRVRGPLTRPS